MLIWKKKARVNRSSIATYLFPLFVFLMLIEGIIRKLMPNQSGVALLIKDVLLFLQTILLTARFLVSSKFRQRLERLLIFPGLRFAIGGFILTGMLSSIALLNGLVSFNTYLIGCREYFIYLPLFFISFDYFQDMKRRERFVFFIIIAAIVVDIAGLLQATGVVNWFLLRPIELHLFEHSSAFGYFNYASSFFDVPERFAVFNLFILIISVSFLMLYQGKSCRFFLS